MSVVYVKRSAEENFYLSLTELKAGNFVQALAYLREAERSAPGRESIIVNTSVVLQKLQGTAEALVYVREKISNGYGSELLDLRVFELLIEEGRLAEARESIGNSSDLSDAARLKQLNRIRLLEGDYASIVPPTNAGEFDVSYFRSLLILGSASEAWSYLSVCAAGVSSLDQALAELEFWLAVSDYEAASQTLAYLTQEWPETPQIESLAFSYYCLVGDVESALAGYQRIARPTADDYLNLAYCFDINGDCHKSEATVDAGLMNHPNDLRLQYGKSVHLLRRKNFEEALKGIGYRHDQRVLSAYGNSIPLQHRTSSHQMPIYVLDQGLGDQVFQLGLLFGMPGIEIGTIAGDPRLLALLERTEVAEKIELMPATLKKFNRANDALATGLSRINNNFSDLSSHHPLRLLLPKLTGKRFGGDDHKLTLGVCWKSHRPGLGPRKSVSLETLITPLQRERFEFLNLQYGIAPSELSTLERELDLTLLHRDENYTEDLMVLVKAICKCNLVLTVSSATAHFAGALGIPTLLFLPSRGPINWYWHLNDTFSIWYPSVRISRDERMYEADLSNAIEHLEGQK